MSPPDSTDKGSFLSRINIYTALLGVAFVALCIACALLALELGRYNWKVQPPANLRPNAWIQSSPAVGQCLLAVGHAHHTTHMDVI